MQKYLSLLLLPVLLFTAACGHDDNSPDELIPDQEVLGDDNSSQLAHEADVLDSKQTGVDDATLEKAYQSFLAKGVPKVALDRTFEFFRVNRASRSGLQDSSCLIKPDSETGAIPANSNKYDPTTLEILKRGVRNERYIMVVDFTQKNTAKRGYLMDLQPDANGEFQLTRMEIAHGYGSKASGGIPQVFTNQANLGTTVSGFFISASVNYSFHGNAASTGAYNSVGLRLYGLESTNNTAERTSKVGHGAPYVKDGSAGNSAGCPAMSFTNAKKWLPQLKGGVLWYHHTKVNAAASYKAPTCKKASVLAGT